MAWAMNGQERALPRTGSAGGLNEIVPDISGAL